MHFTLPCRLALVAAGCALASAVFWGWSRGLPEPNWESSTSPIATAPSGDPSSQAVVVMDASPAPKQSPEKDAPTPDVAQTESEPEPAPSVPPTTPTPDPSPIVAVATPSVEPSEPVSPPEPTPTPAPARPSDDELAGPLPQHSPGDPVIPVATPARLDIGDIARQPQLWPPQVLLLTSQRFPVVIRGVNVGNVQVPAGRPVVLRKVHANGTLEIEFQGSPARVKAQATDLMPRATALAAAREKAGTGY